MSVPKTGFIWERCGSHYTYIIKKRFTDRKGRERIDTDIEGVLARAAELIRLGHAINIAEHGNKIFIQHYLSCRACLRQRVPARLILTR